MFPTFQLIHVSTYEEITMRHLFSLMKPRGRLSIAIGALAAIFTLHPCEAQASKLYWADYGTNKVEKSNLDGSSRVTLGTFAHLTSGIAVDSTNGHVYFSEINGDFPGGTGAILRMNTDGTGVTTLTNTAVLGGQDIALDLAGGKMYWAAQNNNAIRRANLDGTGNQPVHALLNVPTGIALDIPNGKVYWTAFSGGMVQSGNMDGSGSPTNLVTGLGSSNPIDVKLDLANGFMYFSTFTDGTIRRALLDGTGVITLVDSTTFGGITKTLRGLALDIVGGKIFFSNDTDNKIQSVNLNGTGLTDIVTTGLSGPSYLDLELDAAVVPEPSTYALGLIGLVGLGLVGGRNRKFARVSQLDFTRRFRGAADKTAHKM